MNNVEKLQQFNRTALGSVRQRLGGSDANDESFDDDINNMSADEIAEAYTGWHLGDPTWWSDLKHVYDTINLN